MTFDIRKVIPKLPDTGNADSVFERYIPIDHVYGISCRVCDKNQYRKGMIGTPGKRKNVVLSL